MAQSLIDRGSIQNMVRAIGALEKLKDGPSAMEHMKRTGSKLTRRYVTFAEAWLLVEKEERRLAGEPE